MEQYAAVFVALHGLPPISRVRVCCASGVNTNMYMCVGCVVTVLGPPIFGLSSPCL